VRHEPDLERTRALALAGRLRELRSAKGMTQEQAAQAAGMDRNHYQLLESGLSDRKKKTPANPRLSTLAALCAVFDTTVPELVIDIFRASPEQVVVEYDDTDAQHGTTRATPRRSERRHR
jgi:transcriptional regulator with XRE-family HTH domain